MTALAFVELERAESRVLGATSLVDAATRVRIAGGLSVQPSAGARLQRNRSGLYVVTHAAGLAAHESAFDAPPALPPIGSVQVTLAIDDTQGRYLSRLATISLPLDPTPSDAPAPGSLFSAIEIPLYPAPTAQPGANWAVLRVSVSDAASGDALGGALLIASVTGRIVARGLSDWRGEAFVAVPGLPVTTWSDDPDAVVVSEIAAQLDLVFDPAAGTRVAAALVREGRPPAVLPRVDPEAIEAARAALPHASRAVTLASGRAQALSFPLALP